MLAVLNLKLMLQVLDRWIDGWWFNAWGCI